MCGKGLLGPDSTEETQRIHRENQVKLQGMSQSEILQEQRKLLAQLGRLFYPTFFSQLMFLLTHLELNYYSDVFCVVFYPH